MGRTKSSSADGVTEVIKQLWLDTTNSAHLFESSSIFVDSFGPGGDVLAVWNPRLDHSDIYASDAVYMIGQFVETPPRMVETD